MQRRGGAAAGLAVIVAAFLLVVSSAQASTIAYQCGEAICTVDPDRSGATPKTVVPKGRLAGLTRDGKKLSWVPESGGLVQAPVGGGAPVQVYTGSVLNQPSMSPEGTRYLWWYPGPDGWGGLNAVWVNRFTVGQPEPDGVSFCSFCVTSHGWLGETAIAAFPAETRRGEPSMVCRLASTEEEPNVSGSCVQTLVRDARGGIGFPSGNAAGTEIVAALTPGAGTGVEGRIVRYSLATGAAIGDVTEGTTDTTPVFSPEGDRVAFERGDQIVIEDLTSGAERVLGAGFYPFWGGARDAGASVASAALRYRRGRIAVKLRCAGTQACRGTLRIRKGSRTIGSRSYRVKAGRAATVPVTPTSRGRRTIRRKQTVTVTLKPQTGTGSTKTLTLRRR